ncbi:TIGR00270 family protein, partial [Candidatus Woesearchaeota archaeon]|nr:TIGR00270 family protein [Candidatus Woesearchaeota archaeon]
MPTCDMCGSQTEQTFKTKIEGSVLDLCKGCSRFGEVIQTPRFSSKNIPQSRPVERPKRKEVLQLIVPDYAEKIRTAREKLGLTQEEFA